MRVPAIRRKNHCRRGRLRRSWLFWPGAVGIAITLVACAVSPTGRRQLHLFPVSEMAQMGDKAYRELETQKPVSQDKAQTSYVDCVAHAITAVSGPPKGGDQWHVTLFKADDTVNAFALPGGNIGVYTGLLKVTQNAAQLAAVIGHEVGHVEAGHANERLSTTYATETGLQLIQALSGAAGRAGGQQIMALLGVGAQVGVLLPFSRAQESEADVIGLHYMAKAGFDPQQSVDLWQNMSKAAGGGAPPEWLSTHPSNKSRIENLKAHMPEAMTLYRQAQARGQNPQCKRP